jgi:hypothetical protein
MQRLETNIAAVLKRELLNRFHLVERAITVLGRDERRDNRGIPQLIATSLSQCAREYLAPELKILAGERPFVPSPETDGSAMGASAAYHQLEADAEIRDAILVQDDRQMQAELIANGKGLAGVLVEVRDDGRGRTTIPMWVLESDSTLPLHLRENDAVCVVGLPKRAGRIRRIESAGNRYRIEMEITEWKLARTGGIPAAADRRLRGTSVTLVQPAHGGFAMRKVQKIFARGVPGEWLTHAAGE